MEPPGLLRAAGNLRPGLLRNVLIYFDSPTKSAVLDRLARTLPRDGYLFLGGAETVHTFTTAFARVAAAKTNVYQRAA